MGCQKVAGPAVVTANKAARNDAHHKGEIKCSRSWLADFAAPMPARTFRTAVY